jgi:hypothetical protein
MMSRRDYILTITDTPLPPFWESIRADGVSYWLVSGNELNEKFIEENHFLFSQIEAEHHFYSSRWQFRDLEGK